MRKAAVIGGGFAGLSTAVHLAKTGVQIEVFEASPKLGGRAYSFKDEDSGDLIDNGQHILMGCYKDTLQFLNIIGTTNNLLYQEKLKVNFVDREKGIVLLKSITRLYPFNLVAGILNFSVIHFIERIYIIKLFLKLLSIPTDSLRESKVYEWLKEENQSEKAIKSFWEILVVGAMNTSIEKASAKLFADILKQIFFKGNRLTTIIIPKTNLNELFCSKANEFIINHNGKINFSHKVTRIEIIRNKIVSFEVNGKNFSNFDFVVLAVPYYSFQNLSKDGQIIDDKDISFNYSPILNIHIWLKENSFKESFYGLIDSPVHWIFNHKNYITAVISDAGKLIDLPSEEIFNCVKKEISDFFPRFGNKEIVNYKVIKEKRATFIPEPSVLNKRPSSRTKIKNLFIAGDWTNTQLPATIEGAVKSGKIAADLILSEI